jgi:hypothetical protein
MVVRLYDGPLMGINYARPAHATMNEARLLVHRSLSEGATRETVARIEKLITGISDSLKIVRERVDSKDVTVALDRAENHLRAWSDAELKVLKPQAGGLTELPAALWSRRKATRPLQHLMILSKWSQPTALAFGRKRRRRSRRRAAP